MPKKAVLLSLNPKYCELIASGKKTIEVRKTKPKLEPPFKCYIYCVSVKYIPLSEYVEIHQKTSGLIDNWHSKIIGEFVCDEIFPMSITYSDPNHRLSQRKFPFTCLTDKEIMDYLGNGKRGYGWHISDLKIYDMPKELGEFTHCGENYHFNPAVTKPPQSWCYVEEV